MFSNGQNVQANDLNNFSVTTVTTTGDLTIGGAAAITGTVNSQTISSSASFTGSVAVATSLNLSAAGAGQIVFPAVQNASTNANTLDDYEEGSWTPTFGGDGGQSGQTYGIQVGRYVKIGRLVTAQFRVQLSALGTITGGVQVQGLPFTSENVTDLSSSGACGRFIAFTSSLVALHLSINPNSTAIYLWASTAAATGLNLLAQADLSAGTFLEGTITYRATT